MTIAVTVAYSPAPREVLEWHLQLPEGATLREAIAASGLAAACPGVDLLQVTVGIWGRKAAWEQVLRDRDRVEVYRALKVDPKVARRERFRGQGARAAGLFAKKRAGGKPGY
jgi:putative ubiquitin-RnfH superfamily antitoxin RatB of RatAB toxin-antitoxin module